MLGVKNMDIYDTYIEAVFPKIKDAGYKIASPEDTRYNCIAWAAGRDDIFINPDPDYFWPSHLPYSTKLDIIIKLYESYGFIISDSQEYEEGFEKIAIYVAQNTDNVTHAARQIDADKWTSKLGPYKDIEHRTIESLTGSMYGTVARIMKRKKG